MQRKRMKPELIVGLGALAVGCLSLMVAIVAIFTSLAIAKSSDKAMSKLNSHVADVEVALAETKAVPKLSVNTNRSWLLPIKRNKTTIDVGYRISKNGEIFTAIGDPITEFHVVNPKFAGGFIATNHIKGISPVLCGATLEITKLEPKGISLNSTSWKTSVLSDESGATRIFLDKVRFPVGIEKVHAVLTIPAKHPVSRVVSNTFQKMTIEFYDQNEDCAIVRFGPILEKHPIQWLDFVSSQW